MALPKDIDIDPDELLTSPVPTLLRAVCKSNKSWNYIYLIILKAFSTVTNLHFMFRMHGVEVWICTSPDQNWFLFHVPSIIASHFVVDYARQIASREPTRPLRIRRDIDWEPVINPGHQLLLNAILAHTRGIRREPTCLQCRVKIRKDPNGRLHPMGKCVAMGDGEWHDQCANCIWDDNAHGCTFDYDRTEQDRLDLQHRRNCHRVQNIEKDEDIQGPVVREENDNEDDGDDEDVVLIRNRHQVLNIEEDEDIQGPAVGDVGDDGDDGDEVILVRERCLNRRNRH